MGTCPESNWQAGTTRCCKIAFKSGGLPAPLKVGGDRGALGLCGELGEVRLRAKAVPGWACGIGAVKVCQTLATLRLDYMSGVQGVATDLQGQWECSIVCMSLQG